MKKLFKLVLVSLFMVLAVPVFLLFVIASKIALFTKKRTINGIPYYMASMHSGHYLNATKQQLFALSGAFVMNVPKKLVFNSIFSKDSSFKDRVLGLLTPYGYTVHMVKDILPPLTKEETKAIVYHELGHIVHGHVAQEQKPEGAYQREVDADDFAVAHVGSIPLKSALQKVLVVQKDHISAELVADLTKRIDRL